MKVTQSVGGVAARLDDQSAPLCMTYAAHNCWMKRFCIVGLWLVWTGVAAVEPQTAPAWTLQTPDGQTVRYPDDAQAHPSVLLFWPSWCPYSRALQPYVQDIWRDYADAGIKVWTINIRERGDPVAVMRERDLHFPLLLDGDDLIAPYGIVRTPWLVVVAGDGRIVYTRPPSPGGPIEVAKAVRLSLNRLLGAKAVPMPEQFPLAYDLHLRDRDAVDHTGSAPLALPESAWLPWVERYLAGLPEDHGTVSSPHPVADGKHAIALAQAAWGRAYGEEAVRASAQFRAFMRNGIWVVVTVGEAGLGEGLIYAVDQQTGQQRAIEDRR
jgi:peroxiredoxin